MRPLLLIDVVGLTPALVGVATPNLMALQQRGSMAPLEAAFPAVTLTGQASLSTGLAPSQHGIVGNGWYLRETEEVHFWKQPHRLIQAPTLGQLLKARDSTIKVAHLFWWFAMYAPVDISVTPRPMYPADGRKLPDIHTFPADLRDELQRRFGAFPLFHFWGPGADLRSTDWITRAACALVREQRPHLTQVYLPHLDYDFQRYGPDDPRSRTALRAVDNAVGQLVEAAHSVEARVMVLSEYGITPVHTAVHPNRLLRQHGWLKLRNERGREMLDCGASKAFAVVDHQIAHLYVRNPQNVPAVVALFSGAPGIEQVLHGASLEAAGLAHERSGEIVLVAARAHWFAYYWWLNDALAPDYARTVDIHRKPGYDPCELHFDPALRFPKLRVISKLLARKLGQRALLDVIGLDPSVVRGSHGRLPDSPAEGPVLLVEDMPRLPCTANGVVPYSAIPALVEHLIFES
ncbi:MAG: alkaline phosphatase family protein [Planctomycetes bacterium]|nr:alkaline phosphatase family protein [Planctomycetota bacterium]